MSETHYARCPDCDFTKTNISDEEAREYQYNGCPNCDRGVGVSTMANFPN